MIARYATRLVRETRPRALAKLVVNFGLKGMRAVGRFERRARRGEVFPAFLFLSVTSRCNLSCQGCWASPGVPGRDLDPAAVDAVIRSAKARGTTSFGILGGEPLLYPNLLAVLARHPDCYFLLFTNGTLISAEVAAELARMGHVSPLISIEGTAEVSDLRRGGWGVLGKSLEGLEQCRRHGLFTGVATSVCRSNIDDLVSETFVRDVIARGAHYLWYYVYRPVGARPGAELVLAPEQVTALRRFMVDIRSRVPILVVDSYWDHEGRALCPAAVGIGHHVGPGGDVEPCPPLQFAADRITDGADPGEVIGRSAFLAEFRRVAAQTTRGCIIMERPDLLAEAVERSGARDTSGRAIGLAELKAMCPHTSHHVPGEEIPETYWPYRLAKKSWFFGFGAYG